MERREGVIVSCWAALPLLILILTHGYSMASSTEPQPASPPHQEMPASSPHQMPASSPHEVPVSSPHEMPASSPHEVPASSPHEVPASSTDRSGRIQQQAGTRAVPGQVDPRPPSPTPSQSETDTKADEDDHDDDSDAAAADGDGDDDDDDDDDQRFVNTVLQKYGYFREGKPLHLQQRELTESHKRMEREVGGQETARTEAIRRFQSFFGLPLTGRVDPATVGLMKEERCGVADLPDERLPEKPYNLQEDSQSPSDYNLLGSKWHRSKLTWRLDNPSNQLSGSDQRQTMEDAFAMWAQVAPLRFKQRRARVAVDIRIGFVRRSHGDDYPFDGQGKVLAHAFGPGEGDISGDMHMDNDERWSVGSNEGEGHSSDLFLVATHELGHSLGLAHSRDPAALMYPYYGLTEKLGEDDIQAIQSLYGKRIGKPQVKPKPRRRKTTTTSSTPTTTPESATRFQWAKSATYVLGEPPAGCDVTFDVVFQDDAQNTDVYTGIRGDMVYRFNQRGVLNGYPSTLNAVYPGAPSNAGAVFGLPGKAAAYFIKGNRVWRYTESRLDPAYPKALNPAHFRDTIRFVLTVTDASGIQRIFVFGRTLWLEYNFDTLPSYTPHAHVIPQYWPDVAADVMYAVTGYDGNTYFISPKSHVVLNSFRRAVHGGKKEGHPHWLESACHVMSGSRCLHSFGFSFALALVVAIVVLVLTKW